MMKRVGAGVRTLSEEKDRGHSKRIEEEEKKRGGGGGAVT